MQSKLHAAIGAQYYDNATGTGFIIDANSTPVWGYFGFGDAWSTDDFIAWHKALKAKFGADVAKQKFSYAWTNRPWTSAFGTGFRASMFDQAFINYFKAEGFTWNSSGEIILTSVDTAKHVAKAVENTAKAIENITDSATSVGNWILYAVIAVAVFAGAYFLYKTVK